MDLFHTLEIYIPKDTEVKTIPLRSLPKSVLRRIGLPLSDSESSGKLSDSPKGILISPLVIRKKGQKVTSYTGNSGREDMFSLLDRNFQSKPGPFKMAFVSANNTAYKVLKDIMPGTIRFDTDLLPQGSQSYRDAVVIQNSRLFLSINRSRRRQKTCALRASQSTIPKSPNKCQSPQASLEPADTELQSKKLHIILPQTSPKQPKDLFTTTDNYSTTDPELLNDNRTKEKHITRKVTHGKTGKEVLHKGNDVSSSTSVHSVFQSSDSLNRVNSHCHTDDGGERGIQDPRVEEADYMQIDYIPTQSSNQSWTTREPQGTVGASTSLQEEFDFKELAEEEKIALMKAKLRLSEAALNKLHPS